MLEFVVLIAVFMIIVALSIIASDNKQYVRDTVSASNMRRKDARIKGGY